MHSCSSVFSKFPIPHPNAFQPGQREGRKSVVGLRADGLQRCGWGDPDDPEVQEQGDHKESVEVGRIEYDRICSLICSKNMNIQCNFNSSL